MKAIFSSEFATADEVVSQQIDVLGPIPLSWREARNQFFDEDGRPKEGQYAWPPTRHLRKECDG
jgi:serine/threonine-protein kinase SRPK3